MIDQSLFFPALNEDIIWAGTRKPFIYEPLRNIVRGVLI